MKKIGLLGISFFFSLLLLAQKQIDDPNVQVRDVPAFHAIRVATGIKLYLTQGTSEAVAVSASKAEYRDKIVTKVEDGVLKIYYEQEVLKFWKNLNLRDRRPVAYVSAKTLDALDIHSGASAHTEGTITSDKLSLDVSSGGTFNGAVKVNSLDVDQSSGSSVRISGTAGNLKVEGSSGSTFHRYELVTDSCDADVSSGAGAQVTMNKEMLAEATSGGSISYKGDGVIRKVRTGSGGSVSKKK